MQASVRDPYEVLEISRDASDAEVKTAFRRLAVKHHPDRNPNDPHAQTRFKELNQAHQILSDPQKRAAFDRYGIAAFERGAAGSGIGADFFDGGGLDSIFGDILGAFGFKVGERGDVRKNITLSFEQAALGCQTELSYERFDHCESCGGRGAEPGTIVESCSACGGRGRVRFQQGLFPLPVDRVCSRCRGSGGVPRTPCRACRGGGLTKRERTVELTIPPGIDSGSTRVIEGAGNRVRPQRPPGDLELVIEVEPHPFFRRAGDDVVCRVPVTFAQAALGGEVMVPTLDGKVMVRVPPSTQPGSVLRVRGKGIPHRVRGGRGDQLVELSVEVPTKLSDRARELIEELGHELGEDVQPQQKSFVDKLKDLFG
jgi:molecular chaperone DnaJ